MTFAPAIERGRAPADHAAGETLLASHSLADGRRQTLLSVPGLHCGGCMQKVEDALSRLPGVESARVSLAARRATIVWRGEPPPLVETLRKIGYEAHLQDAGVEPGDRAQGELVRALAVAGFAASNIMLLSVSVWSGADPATRELFHGISALIAFPTLLYSGRPFFRSAFNALRHGGTNMDVPISIGVILAFGLSLFETLNHGAHAYFDATVSLLFFLLIGRTLDHLMRERARTAVKGLARMAAQGALVLRPDGGRAYLPVGEIEPGMQILLAAGERAPVDGRVVEGRSDLDASLASGESTPQPASPGCEIHSGMLNLTGPIIVAATATAQDSLLAQMMRMMTAAEAGRSAYRRISDRAARLYAPVVHGAALATFIGWTAATGDVRLALTIAISTLIITCPCALGLAVPMTQVAAARRLFGRGVLLRDGAGLERLAEIDFVLLDKTGTLTGAAPRLAEAAGADAACLAIAGALGAQSRHPYARALARAARDRGLTLPAASDLVEHPGLGVEGRIENSLFRLGRPEWALDGGEEGAQVVLSRDAIRLAGFRFDEQLRPGAQAAVAGFLSAGIPVEILSGDRDAPVRGIARRLGVSFTAMLSPAGKRQRIAALIASGRKPLMIGDGLNDAPSLAAAHASMAPASAADVGRNAADLVLLGDDLRCAPMAVAIARKAAGVVRQNFALAVLYNAVALPVAILGHVTPLIAALAMSLSSILVIANAQRLAWDRRRPGKARTGRPGLARPAAEEPA